MGDRLRRVLVWGWVAAVVSGAAVVIVFVLSGQTTDEQDHRATVWGTLLTAFVAVLPALAWGRKRLARRPVEVSTPGQVGAAADLLAQRVMALWAGQVVTRGIQTPAPVRVRWEWAGEDVAAGRREVLDSPGLGTDPPPLPGCPVGEVLSSGLVARLHDRVYGRLRHGRLVLIGGPGAGKTAAMILLLLEALRHRGQVPEEDRVRVPVPVWLTLGSWNPQDQSLREWVGATMARDHPYLRAVDFGPDAITGLLDGGQVALFLDGLDEMPDRLRPQALDRLAGEAGGLRVVLTCRPGEYRAALQDSDGLPYPAVVDLQPVGPGAAADYLLEGRTGHARRVWQQITGRLQADPGGVLAQVLTTPLALSLARTVGPDPSWLLDAGTGTPQGLRDRLWDQALATAYPDQRERGHATWWLGWIAHHMTTRPGGLTRDLPWWHIPTWVPRWHLRLLAGLVGGLGVGLVYGLVVGLVDGLVVGLVYGLVVALVVGLMVGLMVGPGNPRETTIRWPTRQDLRSLLVFGLVFGLVGGLWGGLVYGLVDWLGVWLWGGLVDWLGGGLWGGLVFGLVFGLVGGVWAHPVAASSGATPRSVYRADIRTQIVGGVGVGVGVGLVFGFVDWFVFGFGFVDWFVDGLVFGLGGGLVGGLGGGAVPSLWMVEVLFRLRGRRVRFLPLLETALQRQVLRQAGAVYQFRHAELQDRLATLYQSGYLTLTPPAGQITDGRSTGDNVG